MGTLPCLLSCFVMVDALTAGSAPPPAGDHSRVPGVVIDYSPASSGKCIGCPAIAILPNGDYVASHSFHNANYLTFHRVRHFRALTMADATAPLE